MHTRNGEPVMVRQDYALGTPQLPAAPAQVRDKFLAGAAARIGQAPAEALLGRLSHLDQVTDCADLLPRMTMGYVAGRHAAGRVSGPSTAAGGPR